MRVLLPRVVNGRSFEIYAHNGKDVLLRRLPVRLTGYRNWLPKDHLILVLVDRDDDDCVNLKRQIEQIASDAGLGTKSKPRRGHVQMLTRIAVEELEAWYFGDWQAVRSAYPRAPETLPAPYRYADRIRGGSWEAFERVMRKSGYFAGGLPKIEAARRIAEEMDIGRNTSPSFRTLFDTLGALCPK